MTAGILATALAVVPAAFAATQPDNADTTDTATSSMMPGGAMSGKGMGMMHDNRMSDGNNAMMSQRAESGQDTGMSGNGMGMRGGNMMAMMKMMAQMNQMMATCNQMMSNMADGTHGMMTSNSGSNNG